ncbi:MAG: dihydroorotase [Desulfobacterales bacterium SG8_35_2]|nr:MAG: dihydroorotase [Desulfobacterales bacterium SG8_35_2]
MAMVQTILLKNGRLIDPVNRLDKKGSILLEKGRIKAIFSARQKTGPLPKKLLSFDLQGKWVVPGLIDMHVHLREPGEEHKETIESGTRAAAAGGFTAVACMPNTNPVNDCQSVTRLILEKAESASARVYPVGAISKGSLGKSLAEFGDMKKAGAVAVTDDGKPVTDSQLLRRALEYASNHKMLVISHSEDASLSRNGAMNEGFTSTSMGLKGIPHIAEEIMVYRDLAVADFTGCHLHLAHISTRESINLIRQAKKNGCPVTAETAPHYFTLTEEAVKGYNTNAKMNPPLRTPKDRAAVIAAIEDGTIDVIATDHAPHSVLEKDIEFDQAANGIIGLETAVPLALALFRKGYIDALRLVELLSSNPARILGVKGGSLGIGAAADIAVIDPEHHFILQEQDILSKSKNSPFLGARLQGKAVLTLCGGTITHNLLTP